jgi:NADH:ubiquinone oxidoreductase subunit 2 (subunit N)
MRKDLDIIDVPVKKPPAEKSLLQLKESRDFFVFISVAFVLGTLFFWAVRAKLLMLVLLLISTLTIYKLVKLQQKLNMRLSEREKFRVMESDDMAP